MRLTRHMIIAAPALLLGLLFFGCSKKEEAKPAPPPAPPPETTVLATVNGDPITLGEFLERFTRAGLRPEKEAELQVMEEFLNRLIERKMMLREAQRRRIVVSLQEINKRVDAMRTGEGGKDIKEALAGLGIDFEKWKSDIWEDLMIEKLIARDVIRTLHVSSSEVRRYYQENPQEFQRPEQVRVRQIVVDTEEEAQKILDQLLNEKADFAKLARQRSTAPEADEGGDLGYFAMGEMPGEFNVVFGLPRGGISSVVKSPYGYHIFKLEEKRKAGKITLEEASRSIAEKLSRQKQDARYKQWLTELRGRTKFVVNYQALQH